MLAVWTCWSYAGPMLVLKVGGPSKQPSARHTLRCYTKTQQILQFFWWDALFTFNLVVWRIHYFALVIFIFFRPCWNWLLLVPAFGAWTASRGDWKARTRFPRGKSSAAGRAWAMSTGRPEATSVEIHGNPWKFVERGMWTSKMSFQCHFQCVGFQPRPGNRPSDLPNTLHRWL